MAVLKIGQEGILDNKIIKYLREKGQASAKELAENLGIPERSLYRDLNQLLKEGQIIRVGERPHVVYELASDSSNNVGAGSKPAQTRVGLEPTPTSQEQLAPTPVPEKPKSELLIYWCKILRLEPEAVIASYSQIHPLVPSYQSVGLNPPRTKKGHLKVPAPLWGKLFDVMVWMIAIKWTFIKKLWTSFRSRSHGSIPWSPIFKIVIVVFFLSSLAYQFYFYPQSQRELKILQEQLKTAQAQLDIFHTQDSVDKKKLEDKLYLVQEKGDDLKEELRKTKDQLEQKVRDVAHSDREYDRINNELMQLRQELHKSERQRSASESAVSAAQNERDQMERVTESLEIEKRYLNKKLDESKSEARELKNDLFDLRRQNAVLEAQLKKTEERKGRLEREIEELKKNGK